MDQASEAKVSVAAGRSELQKRRQECSSILHFGCNMLLRQQSALLWRGMSLIALPLERYFSESVTAVETMKGAQNLHFELCRGSLRQVACDIWARCSSEAVADALGLTRETPASQTAHAKQHVQAGMDKMLALALELSGNLVVTGASYAMPPLCFIPLVRPEPRARAECLEGCKRMWSCLLKMEATALHDSACHSFLRNLGVGYHQFARELFVRLSGCDFREVLGDVREDVREYSQTFLSSLVCEEAMNKLRATASCNRAGRLNPAACYHGLSSASNVLEAFGRKPLVVTSAARHVCKDKVPKSMFDPSASDCSLPTEDWMRFATRRTLGPL